MAELEKIDDDCDKQGIQFVKIDDSAAAKEFGIDSIPALVYFEKEIPNVYDGDLDNEDEILEWLVSQLESDEIEDVTDEMLDKMIKEGKTLAVLFCTWRVFPLVAIIFFIFFKMTTMTENRKESSTNSKILTTSVISTESFLLKLTTRTKLLNTGLRSCRL